MGPMEKIRCNQSLENFELGRSEIFYSVYILYIYIYIYIDIYIYIYIYCIYIYIYIFIRYIYTNLN